MIGSDAAGTLTAVEVTPPGKGARQRHVCAPTSLSYTAIEPTIRQVPKTVRMTAQNRRAAGDIRDSPPEKPDGDVPGTPPSLLRIAAKAPTDTIINPAKPVRIREPESDSTAA